MVSEFSPERQGPSRQAIELAGALQGVVGDVRNRGFGLDLHQEETINAIGQRIIGGDKTGYIESATGSGKALYIALLTEAAVRAGQRVHILAPTVTIADQLIGADGESGIGRFTGLLGLGAVKQNYGGRRGNSRHPVVVSTYPGALQEAKLIEAQGHGKLGQFNLILGDECHRSLGTETSFALYGYMPGAVKLGFSATPDYALDRRSDEIWGESWFEFSLRSAIESGKSAPVRALLLATNSELNLSDYRNEFTERELAPLINNPERNGIALKLTQDFIADGRQGIIACIPGEANVHARTIAGLLSSMKVGDRNIVARDVGSHLTRDEQQRRLKAYRNGEIDILTFTRALEEGWDSDRASFCLNLAPTTSPVRTKQLLGRIVRPKADGREGIFVDFVDEKVGMNKEQYTALHALDIEKVDLNRVLGWGGAMGGKSPAARNLGDWLRPELLERLMRAQGKTLADALVANSRDKVVDPIAAKWERTLAKEGMPAELPDNIVFTPALDRKYQQAVDILRRDLGEEPTSDQVADYLRENGITKDQEAVVRNLGQRVLLTEGETLIMPARESVEDIVTRLEFKKIVGKVLDTLSEREAGVISLHFGISDNIEHDLGEIGQVYGVTGPRIRQIESKTMSKLRHPIRSQSLKDFVDELVPPEDKQVHTQPKATEASTAFKDTYVPVYDREDHRPYTIRLVEASQMAAKTWLKENTNLLDAFVHTRLEADAFLKGSVHRVQPVGVEINGKFHAIRPEDSIDGEVTNVYDRNELRAAALQRKQVDITRQLQPLLSDRRRVIERPLQSRDARAASLVVLDAKIEALERFSSILQDRITAYLDEAVASPQHVTFK